MDVVTGTMEGAEQMIRCTNVGVEPSEMCYEICVLAYRCGALKAWEKERERKAENNELHSKQRIMWNL